MPHYPKPFFKKSHKTWFVQLDGRQVSLGKVEAEAFERYHELMHARANGQTVDEISDNSDNISVIEVLDRFLDACEKDSAPRTFEAYRNRLRPFVRQLDSSKKLDLAATELRPFHVLDWLDAHPGWSQGMRRGGIQAVQRAFNWAAEVGLIESSPIARMRKPAAGKLDTSVSEDEYSAMMINIPAGPFKELLRFAWLTGSRPQESIRIEARHCDLANDRIVLPPS